MYDSILARSFSRHEQKKLGFGAIICCLIVALFFCTFFKPYLGPIPDLNLQLSMGVGLKMLAAKATKTSQRMIFKSAVRENHKYEWQKAHFQGEKAVICDTERARTELCEIKSEARVETKSSSIFAVSSSQTEPMANTIRPYARNEDSMAMAQVKKWSVELKPEKGLRRIPKCTRKHKVPAVLFSLGGYAGNNFHSFSDVIIPLFITSRHYNREVQFLITDNKPYFVSKFRKILKGLSKYEPIDIDKEGQQVHCFPSAVIGLKRDSKEMSIDPEKHSTSMKEFRSFLRKIFSLNRAKAVEIRGGLRGKKPHLLVLSRKKTRAFTNVGEIEEMGRSLGYKVTVAEANSSLERFSEMVNSCDVFVGVHGAGLTNMVFLPEDAVFIQIVPVGGFEWLAKTDFGSPSKGMNLNYLEYKISKEESTLIEQYPIDHKVFTDPYSIQKQGWEDFKSIFLVQQNVNLNVTRFKPTLEKALQILRDQSLSEKV